MCGVCRCNPFRSTLNTRYITRFDMCAVCTDAVHSVTSHLYDRCSPLRHAGSAYRCSPFRSTLTTRDITFRHVCSVYKCSQLQYSTLNTNYIRRLDMCAMCADPVHSTWTCVTCVLSHDMFGHVQSMYGSRLGHVRILGFSASARNSASRLLGFARGIRLLGFSASPGEFGFSASRLRPGNSASRLLGFARGIRLLGFSASPGEFGFSASRLRSGNSASRLLGFPPLSAGPLYRRYAYFDIAIFMDSESDTFIQNKDQTGPRYICLNIMLYEHMRI